MVSMGGNSALGEFIIENMEILSRINAWHEDEKP